MSATSPWGKNCTVTELEKREAIFGTATVTSAEIGSSGDFKWEEFFGRKNKARIFSKVSEGELVEKLYVET